MRTCSIGTSPFRDAPFIPFHYSLPQYHVTFYTPRHSPFFPLSSFRTLKKPIALSVRAATKEINVDPKNVDADPSDTDDSDAVSRDWKDEDWEKAYRIQESGILENVKVEGCNSGGLLVRFGSISGFLPYSQIASKKSSEDGKTIADVGKELIGQTLLVKVLEVNKAEKRLVVSEKKAVWLQSVQQLKEGDVFSGKVNYVTDFGAFVDLRFPDGSYPVTGLVHVSELSWDKVYDPRDVIEEGQIVQVKVISFDLDRMRLALSIKQLQNDPLLETLDTLMPQEDPYESMEDNLSETMPGLEEICRELLQEDGITEVTPGRMAIEKRVVSQDLQLWLSSAPVEEGSFILLARAGRQVQEVQVKTILDREGIKAALQRVSVRVP